jgi:hypothetical protein
MDKLLWKIFRVGQRPRKGRRRELTYEGAMQIVRELYK